VARIERTDRLLSIFIEEVSGILAGAAYEVHMVRTTERKTIGSTVPAQLLKGMKNNAE
jgi:hypothetical protein